MLNATLPMERGSVETAVVGNRTESLEETRWIFFAGEAIPSNEKYEMFGVKGFGGIYMPHLKTLPVENKGMLYRCKLTPLKTRRISEWNNMLSPVERKLWEKSFVQSKGVLKDGEWRDHTVNGFTGSDPEATKAGRFETKQSDHLVFKPRYPGEEIQQAVKRSLPHGVGGVVHVTALQGMSDADGYQAQLFFFPDWVEIRKGSEGHALPDTLRETEDHIRLRIKAINTEAPFEKRELYGKIGAAMLQSCDEYRRATQSNLQKTETSLKAAALKGDNTHAYPASAEMQLAFTESRRKDEVVSGESSAVDRLARAMENSGKFTEGKPDLEAQRLELELLKERNRAKELEIEAAKAIPNTVYGDVGSSTAVPTFRSLGVADLPINPDILTASTGDLSSTGTVNNNINTGSVDRVCAKPKTNGEPCERILKEGQTACFQHPD